MFRHVLFLNHLQKHSFHLYFSKIPSPWGGGAMPPIPSHHIIWYSIMIYPSRFELIWTLICKYNIFNVLFIRNFNWYTYEDRPTLEKYDVHWIIILKGAVILHHIDVEMSKMFATCGGDTPNPPPGTLPPCLNPLGVDTYDIAFKLGMGYIRHVSTYTHVYYSKRSHYAKSLFWNNWSIYLCSRLGVKLKFYDYLSTMFKHISIVYSMVMADTYISWSKLGCYPFSWNCG